MLKLKNTKKPNREMRKWTSKQENRQQKNRLDFLGTRQCEVEKVHFLPDYGNTFLT